MSEFFEHGLSRGVLCSDLLETDHAGGCWVGAGLGQGWFDCWVGLGWLAWAGGLRCGVLGWAGLGRGVGIRRSRHQAPNDKGNIAQ